jgi:hypothetical protein
MSRKNQEIVRNSTETHRENLRKLLEHRLEVARSRGDENLIQMLEAEYKQLS